MEHNVDVIELPSQGKYYDSKLPGGEVKISPMTTKEESLIASKRNRSDAHLILDTIVEGCMKTNFPVDKLLVSDELYILLMVRVISYGSEYKYNVKCPYCKDKFPHTVNIPGDFIVHLPEEEYKEPFIITLPKCGKKVGFRLLRVGDEIEVREYSRTAYRKSLQQGDPGYIYRLAKCIMTLDDEEISIKDAIAFVTDLIGFDSSYLKEAYGKANPGIDLSINISCKNPDCGEDFDTKLAMDKEFFRPSSPEIQFA